MNHLRKLFFIAFALTLVGAFAAVQAPSAQAQAAAPFRIYLAFEDGPTQWYTPGILDILAQYNAKATFFINGYQIEGREEILQRTIREGHALANHLWEEPGFYTGSPDERIIAAYLRTETAMREALGDALPIYDAQPKLFRHPGGSAAPLPYIEGVNVITYNPNVDSDDCGWFLDSSGFYDDDVLANLMGDPVSGGGDRWNVYEYGDGAVVAFHDINRVPGRVLPVFMEAMTAAGATFHALPRPGDAMNTMPVVLGTPPQEGPGVPGYTMPVELRDTAFVRAAPYEGSELLAIGLPAGTHLTATGRNERWYRVSVDGQTGWIWRGNVRPRGAVPNLPYA
ncbi:MAG: polysaccharide deacetylase family protein, partial [Chloroflexota bacterium]